MSVAYIIPHFSHIVKGKRQKKKSVLYSTLPISILILLAFHLSVDVAICLLFGSGIALIVQLFTSAQADLLYKPIFNAATHTMIFPAADFGFEPEPSSSDI